MSQINPKRRKGNDLYNFTKGAKNISISPVEVIIIIIIVYIF